MEKTKTRKGRGPMPYWVNQCLYGVSIVLTFFTVGQVFLHL